MTEAYGSDHFEPLSPASFRVVTCHADGHTLNMLATDGGEVFSVTDFLSLARWLCLTGFLSHAGSVSLALCFTGSVSVSVSVSVSRSFFDSLSLYDSGGGEIIFVDLEFSCVMGAAWDLMYLMERYRYAPLPPCYTLPFVFSSVSTSTISASHFLYVSPLMPLNRFHSLLL